MTVNPGELNKSITVIKRTESVDADGYKTVTETVVHSCKAKFHRVSATEKFKAAADMSVVEARFLIRFTNTEINRKMLVRYAGNDYQIEYVNDYDDSRQYIELWCVLQTTEAGI